jgi:hypothetical protein
VEKEIVLCLHQSVFAKKKKKKKAFVFLVHFIASGQQSRIKKKTIEKSQWNKVVNYILIGVLIFNWNKIF